MSSTKRDERGFSHIETVLVVAIVAVIGFVGWYVYHANQNTNKTLGAANSTSNGAGPNFNNNSKQSSANSGATSNASLQAGLSSAASAGNQGSKDISTANDSLDDQSTMTSVPQ